jgi:hypothetical protein
MVPPIPPKVQLENPPQLPPKVEIESMDSIPVDLQDYSGGKYMTLNLLTERL